jgi:hypothetical protein
MACARRAEIFAPPDQGLHRTKGSTGPGAPPDQGPHRTKGPTGPRAPPDQGPHRIRGGKSLLDIMFPLVEQLPNSFPKTRVLRRPSRGE